ncbi:hypothetical protein DH2020_019183 [Rehmannia glutinosa]|uniref:Reverse transcriptase Ty1/copia-type domain-containing protein n=1 Tax=Rehmannia glutinosa TaxID=99300 RepID=A0ABR0WMX3_REHGL
MTKEFEMTDIGLMAHYLGIEIKQKDDGIFISQEGYTKEILKKFKMDDCNPINTPVECGLKLCKDDHIIKDVTSYRRLVGKLIYLSITRPDITYAVNILSQFMDKPESIHLDSAYRILRYLKGTIGQGIFYSSHSELTIKAYSDSDWASCPETRRSTTGYCIFLGDSLISWRTKKQATISRSSTEAEYRALAQTCCEMTWISYLLAEFQVKIHEPSTLYCDNQSAIYLTRNPVFHERTKHVEIDCHFVRQQVLAGKVKVVHMPSKFQLADLFTKGLSADRFEFLLSKMSILEHLCSS